jgi:ATP-dependent Clp protease ATP-binding subunit ClpC
MFERFTESARRALFFARYEASELGSAVIGTEHLLLGLTRQPTAIVGSLLARSGKPLKAMREEIAAECQVREKIATSVEIPFSAEAKQALIRAEDEANRLRHNYIGLEHLLLGLMRVEESIAARVLTRNGIRLDPLRIEVERLRNEGGRPAGPAAPIPRDRILEHIQRIKNLVDRLPALTSNPQATIELVHVIHVELSTLIDGLSPPSEPQ